ncbi:MAG: DUF2760 domain-containing protein [Deltaproteobacteria bacterium]|nr:DUF2760 domain-containing protein [Deltaproteobacteria bacterium]
MEDINRSLRRTYWWILLWMLMLSLCAFSALFWVSMDTASKVAANPQSGPLAKILIQETIFYQFPFFLGPGLLLASFLFSWFAWMSVRRTCARHMAKAAAVPDKKAKKQKDEEPAARPRSAREIVQDTERQTLHFLGLLQREGRLMDFFSEDLSLYDDAQIGAAARAVHESCKKLVETRLKPVAVIASEEGETVSVEPGFDPSAIRLSGNVAGNPPFRGVLKHRGWKASRYEMPELISQSDPRIIAPAEVEIS